MKDKNSLASMRKLFCYYYLKNGNVEQSAIKAGFPTDIAYVEGMRTLEMSAYQKIIQNFKNIPVNNLIWAGLERLAFGSINDAIFLVFSEELPPPSTISKLDLFNVSEIKRVKGGGVEIKTFDRQKALEKMLEYSNSSSSSTTAKNLIDALCSSNGGDNSEY